MRFRANVLKAMEKATSTLPALRTWRQVPDHDSGRNDERPATGSTNFQLSKSMNPSFIHSISGSLAYPLRHESFRKGRSFHVKQVRLVVCAKFVGFT